MKKKIDKKPKEKSVKKIIVRFLDYPQAYGRTPINIMNNGRGKVIVY